MDRPGYSAGLFREADERELVELLREYRDDGTGVFTFGFPEDSVSVRGKRQRISELLARIGMSIDQFMREKGHPDYQEPPT